MCVCGIGGGGVGGTEMPRRRTDGRTERHLSLVQSQTDKEKPKKCEGKISQNFANKIKVERERVCPM